MNRGWILGDFKKDLFYLILPGFAGAVFAAFFSTRSLAFSLFAFFALVIVDSGHVYTTAWRTFFRREERISRAGYWLVPLGIVAGTLVWMSLKIPYIWSFVVYATVYHHITQFYGFLRWYQKLNESRSAAPGYFLFALLTAPFIIFHFRLLPTGGLYTNQDIFFYPNPAYFRIGLLIYGLIVLSWLGYEVWRACKKTFRTNQFLAVASPAFLYAYCFLAAPSVQQVVLPLLLAHGIPYVAVMGQVLPKIDRRRFATIFKAVWILIATALAGGAAEWFYGNYLIPIDNDYVQAGISVAEAFLIGIYLVPVLCHYIFDGWIWKSRHPDAPLIYSNS